MAQTAKDDILVKFMLNGRETSVPVATDMFRITDGATCAVIIMGQLD